MQDFGTILNSNTVRFERLLYGPVDRAWDFITGPEGIVQWLFARSNFELHEGGRVDLKFGTPDPQNGHIYNVRGTVSRIIPKQLIEYSWIETSTDLTSSVLFELHQEGENVRLTVTHSYVSPEFMPKVGAGWHAHLDALVSILRGEKPAEFLPAYNDLLKIYSSTVAATVLATATISPAIAASNDPAYKAVNAQRQQLLTTYDRIWKEADELRYQIDSVRKLHCEDSTRTQQDLERELKLRYDELRKVEYDIRDLDKVMVGVH